MEKKHSITDLLHVLGYLYMYSQAKKNYEEIATLGGSEVDSILRDNNEM